MDNTTATYSFNTNNLPDDVLSYTDDKFYDFVKEVLGQSSADLLEIQSINNVPSFLLSDDVCDVIELAAESEEIDALRKKIAFAFRDGTYRIKIGIRNNFRYLNKLLSAKLQEENKKQRNQRKTTTKTDSTPPSLITETNRTTATLATINSISPLSDIPCNSTSPSSDEQDNSTSPSSDGQDNLTPPPSNVLCNSASSLERTTISRVPLMTTKDEHSEYIVNLINKWIENNKENLNFDQLELKSDIDYTINVTNNNDVIEGNLRCRCGTRITLRKRGEVLQITNFYKHLRSATCSMMQEKRKQYNQQEQLSNSSISNDNDINDDDINNDDQLMSFSPVVPPQSLSSTTIDESISQSHGTNIISSLPANGTKRNSSSAKITHLQQSSAKRHKK